MGYSILAWNNPVKTATLTPSGSGSAAGLSVSQLQNDQGSPSTAWQTTNTSASLSIDSGNPAAIWRVFALARTNLTAAATVRWRVGSYDTGVIAAGVVPKYLQSVTIASADQTGQVVLLDISDPTNPDGFLNIPLMFAGPAWQPQIGVSWASTFGRDVQIDEVSSRAGQEFPTLRWKRRRWAIELNAVRAAEVYAKLDDLDGAVRDGRNVFFCPDYSAATLGQSCVYGRCAVTQDVTFPYQGADARSWKANITERL